MSNRKEEVTKFVRERLRSSHHVRCDCPWCGGKNTFSAVRDNGRLSWNCFRAGCDVRGHLHVDKSIRDLQATIEDSEREPRPIEIPGSWVPPLRDERAVKYLHRSHCMRAYQEGRAKIYWCVATERVVFAITNARKEVVDAACRRIQGEGPKWLRYSSPGTREPFVTEAPNDSCPVVVVEDAASACAVAPFAIGVALLGTHLMATHVLRIRQLNRRVLVALDPDATMKGVHIAKQLGFMVPAEPVHLIEEFKNMREEETEQWVKTATLKV